MPFLENDSLNQIFAFYQNLQANKHKRNLVKGIRKLKEYAWKEVLPNLPCFLLLTFFARSVPCKSNVELKNESLKKKLLRSHRKTSIKPRYHAHIFDFFNLCIGVFSY